MSWRPFPIFGGGNFNRIKDLPRLMRKNRVIYIMLRRNQAKEGTR
jgi:hypothetical protein